MLSVLTGVLYQLLYMLYSNTTHTDEPSRMHGATLSMGRSAPVQIATHGCPSVLAARAPSLPREPSGRV